MLDPKSAYVIIETPKNLVGKFCQHRNVTISTYDLSAWLGLCHSGFACGIRAEVNFPIHTWYFNTIIINAFRMFCQIIKYSKNSNLLLLLLPSHTGDIQYDWSWHKILSNGINLYPKQGKISNVNGIKSVPNMHWKHQTNIVSYSPHPSDETCSRVFQMSRKIPGGWRLWNAAQCH